MLTSAAAIVRAWTWLYTCGLDPDPRDDRRAEIDSDLWELRDDAAEQHRDDWTVAAQMIARLLLGIPDDLLWRSEQLSARAAVVAIGHSNVSSRPLTLRRVSGFGASATVHVVVVTLIVWLAPHLRPVALRGSEATGPLVVFVPSPGAAKAETAIVAVVSADDVPPVDDLGIKVGNTGTRVEMPGFTFDFSKVITHARSLFPFVTGTSSLERIAAAAMLPRRQSGLINPFSRGAGGEGDLPALQLDDESLQAAVDKAWARRDRWRAFTTVVPFADRFNANTGKLPSLFRGYVEQNGLQPYVQNDVRDPRVWTQLGVAADHVEFIDFISRYLAKHPHTKGATELLFLLDTLVQGNYDTLTALLDVVPEEDLGWTRESNAAAYDAIVRIQQYYRAELERRNLTSRTALRFYYDAARISILSNLIDTTPDGYRASDAQFLLGTIYWKQGRIADALAAWRDTVDDPTDYYFQSYRRLRDILDLPAPRGLDVKTINQILDSERGRWISFSHDRLKHFGFRFNDF